MNVKKDSRLWDLAAYATMLFAAVLYTREIANIFLWGHDGGNGAPYFAAAHASVRFHTLWQAKGYVGLTPPGHADFYMHHPILLHLHLVLVRVVLGSSEWVGRLVPFAYSVGVLFLLHRVARRAWSAPFAFVATAIYALTPLHAIYATMINHEQGAIFWCLVAVVALVRSLKGQGDKRRILLVVSTTLAVQYAWLSYFVIAAAGALAVLMAIRARGATTRRRFVSTATTLLITGVANVCLFALLIWWAKGGFSDLRAAGHLRSGEATSYGETLVGRAFDLYGVGILGVAALGTLRLLVRAKRGQLMVRDLIAVSFALGQVGLSAAFRNAGGIHAFWTYGAGIAIALLGAEGVITVRRALEHRFSRRIAIGFLVVALLLQIRTTIAKREWGLATGLAAYTKHDDQFELVQLAQWLGAHYGRDVTYQLHESLGARVETYYYLDAPFVPVDDLEKPSPPCRTKACVLVLDLRSAPDALTRTIASRHARTHRTHLFGGHFVVIETNTTVTERAAHAYQLVSEAPSGWHRWFVSARHPPASWREHEEDVDAEILAGTPIPTSTADTTASGRGAMELCAGGSPLTAMVMVHDQGNLISLRGKCGAAMTPWVGQVPRREHGETVVGCDGASALLGLGLASASAFGAASPWCAGGVQPPSAYKLTCPENTVGVGIRARTASAGKRIVGIGIACGPPI